jgi:hypothetical protein
MHDRLVARKFEFDGNANGLVTAIAKKPDVPVVGHRCISIEGICRRHLPKQADLQEVSPRNHRCGGTFVLGKPFQRLEITMKRVAAAIVAGLLGVSAAAAQSTGTSDAKPETACTTSPAATTGSGEEKTANSMSVEKSAILPEAGGSNSAAPTVQSGGKPLKVSPDCPPDSKPK